MSQGRRNGLLGAAARAEEWLFIALGWTLVALLAGMVVVVSLQVLSRYMLGTPLIWSEEVARLLFICLIFIGTAVLARRGGHLTVTAFVDLLPSRGRHLAQAATSTVGLICAAYLVRGAWATFLREWDQRTPALQAPMGVVFAVILMSCVLLVFWLAMTLVGHLRAAATGARGPGEGPRQDSGAST